MMVYGSESAITFLRQWLADKTDIILMTGSTSYSKCGAEAFLSRFLESKRYCRMTTVGENARKEDVDAKVAAILSNVSAAERVHLAFIAVGGGTVIDTTKLVRDGVNSAAPFLAIPTTAGTGAEATRFAVYYDHGKKMSADDVRYLPTDVALIPEFTATQSPYQRASTEFDAYAQAVESLWAKGATDESRAYAIKALEYFNTEAQGHRDPEKDAALLNKLLGAYWAGRAIDISRTTAAHAFSYYLTSHYGIPHGHAVFMVFPYILKNNTPYLTTSVPPCPCASVLKYDTVVEDVNRFHTQGLTTLREFAAEKNLSWPALIDALFANVNPARLDNNPCEVRKESFLT